MIFVNLTSKICVTRAIIPSRKTCLTSQNESCR